jgi:hypothetical protein
MEAYTFTAVPGIIIHLVAGLLCSTIAGGVLVLSGFGMKLNTPITPGGMETKVEPSSGLLITKNYNMLSLEIQKEIL